MEIFRKLYPKEFLKKYTSQGIRPDGRKLERARKLGISGGTITSASGSAVVSLNHTRVVAGVRAELGRVGRKKMIENETTMEEEDNITTTYTVVEGGEAPLFAQSGQSGLDCSSEHIAVNVDMPPLCSSKFKGGPGGRMPEEALIIAQRINNVIRTVGANLVEPKQFLFDDEGLYTWFLHVDVTCLDYDGSVYDACLMAAIAALKTVTLWRGHVDEETERPIAHADSALNLNLGIIPISSTFATFDGCLLVDPTSEEENLQDSRISVTCDNSGRLYELYKPDGSSVSLKTISQCIQIAKKRAERVSVAIANLK